MRYVPQASTYGVLVACEIPEECKDSQEDVDWWMQHSGEAGHPKSLASEEFASQASQAFAMSREQIQRQDMDAGKKAVEERRAKREAQQGDRGT